MIVIHESLQLGFSTLTRLFSEDGKLSTLYVTRSSATRSEEGFPGFEFHLLAVPGIPRGFELPSRNTTTHFINSRMIIRDGNENHRKTPTKVAPHRSDVLGQEPGADFCKCRQLRGKMGGG